jgi:molecular chaperone GrpE
MSSPSAWTEPDSVEPAGGPAYSPPAGGDAPPSSTGASPAETARPSADDERLLRAMADLDNMRRRFHREVVREREAERSRVAAEWLPVVDDLDRALEHAMTVGNAPQGILDGLRAVRDHALAVLARLGFPRFEDVGAQFDPARHEAVSAVEADAPPGTVVAVVRPGYGSGEAVLRPAAVVVARA